MIVIGQRVACVTPANLSSDFALVPRRLGGVLLSACVILITLSVLYTVFLQCSCTRPSALYLMTLLHLCIKAQTQKHNIHWTHVVACFPYRKAKKHRSNPKGIFFTKSEIIRMKITLQIEDLIHGITGTHSFANQQSHENSISRDCKGWKIGRHLITLVSQLTKDFNRQVSWRQKRIDPQKTFQVEILGHVVVFRFCPLGDTVLEGACLENKSGLQHVCQTASLLMEGK